MHLPVSRALRFALALSIAFAGAAPAQNAKDGRAQRAANDPGWLYRGSDIPPDLEWVFGELPNGLRYAVRRNGVPPHQVSIRIAVDAGILAEHANENGYAHFNEHLAFRGSRYVPDGEAKRLWQRLGATFGSDTNAETSPTQTVYKIDLPNATIDGLNESLKVLSGMLAYPDITKAEVDAERRTLLAEARERSGAGQRVGDASRAILFAGQPLGRASKADEMAATQAATVAGLRAFHDRWYRPEHITIAIAGDADPAVFEELIRKYYSSWKGVGPHPAAPDFGAPSATAPRTGVVVEPGAPTAVTMAILRPWHQIVDNIEYNRKNLIRQIAARVINRRLETRARAGGSFLTASIDESKLSRSVDGTFINIVPIGDDWASAVRDVRAVIADALVRPATQDEIDRENREYAAALQQAVDTDVNDPGTQLADNLIEAVNIRETVASPEVAKDVFTHMDGRLTPATIMGATHAMMEGTPMRAVLTLPKADPDAKAKLAALLAETPKAGLTTASAAAVSFDALPKFGPPGKLVTRSSNADVGLTLGEFANGTRLVLYPHPTETGRIFVRARFGGGLRSLPTDRSTAIWAGDGALIQGGIGALNQEQLDRLTSGRRIGIDLATEDDAFLLKGVTNPADLADQLKIMAAALAFPRWDPAPVVRTRAATLLGLEGYKSSPAGVLNRALLGLIHNGDARWTPQTRTEVEALTPASFRATWEPILASGPIELSIYGDINEDTAIAAAAATFGALPARKPYPSLPASMSASSVRANAAPLRLTHSGPVDQAAAAIIWPTSGGLADYHEAHRLDVLAQIFNDRLFDKLREGDGAAYSPSVGSDWPAGLSGGGNLIAMSQLQPRSVDRFFALSRQIAQDLATKPVTPDEFTRAVLPMRDLIQRASTGSSFWLSQLGGVSFEPRRVDALKGLATDYRDITPADIQATAKRWLVPGKAFTVVVLPEKK